MKAERPSLSAGYCAIPLPEKTDGVVASSTSLIQVRASVLDQTIQNGQHSASGHRFPTPETVIVDPETSTKPKPKRRVPTGSKGAVAPKKGRASTIAADKLTGNGNGSGKQGVLEGLQASATENKPRKPRVKKDKVERQPKINRGTITKPGIEDGKEKTVVKRKRSTLLSGKAEPTGSTGSVDVVELHNAEQDLGLVKAVRRRKCWTPPKETGQLVAGACETTESTVRSVEPPPITSVEPSSKSIGSLFSSFGFAQVPEGRVVPQAARGCDSVVLTKRRRIEASST